MPFLEIENVGKSFDSQLVLDGVSLTVGEGEVLALLGPSGSGKTTLLRIIAGFEKPNEGTIRAGGEAIDHLPPSRRGFGMVFQHYALFPHMSVGENVSFGLHGWGLEEGRVEERIVEVLSLVDLAGFEDRRVDQISGGQQQRVALARALAPKPRLLLLDEPLSNLDPDLREQTRRRLRETLDQIGITTVLVTHEQDEAFDLGDRVAVLERGRLQQVDRADVLYREPVNRFVAGFVGRASLIRGVVGEREEVVVGEDPVGEPVVWRYLVREHFEPGTEVDVMVRPESLRLVPSNKPASLGGRTTDCRFSGMVSFVTVELADGQRVEVASSRLVEEAEAVGVALRPDGPPVLAFAAEEEA